MALSLIGWAGHAQVDPTIEGLWEPIAFNGSIFRLLVRPGPLGTWTVHGWGQCEPAPGCDWGEVWLNVVTPFTPGALQGWFTTWEWPFETSYLSLTSNGDLLRADLLVVFHDGSGRKPYSTVNYLSRVKPNTVAIFYRDPVRTLMYPMLRINLEVGWKVQTSASLTASAVWWDFPTVPDRFDYEIEPAAAQPYFRIRKQE